MGTAVVSGPHAQKAVVSGPKAQKLLQAAQDLFDGLQSTWSLGIYLGFLTESNKQFIRFSVTGPIFKSTTEVTWAGRERKHRTKNDVEPRVHWTLNTTHQFIIIAASMIS
jgi:hypothetical protein